jgi:hypothetical protein
MNCAQSDFVASRAAGRASSRPMEAGRESLAPRKPSFLEDLDISTRWGQRRGLRTTELDDGAADRKLHAASSQR